MEALGEAMTAASIYLADLGSNASEETGLAPYLSGAATPDPTLLTTSPGMASNISNGTGKNGTEVYTNNYDLPWWQELIFITMFVIMFVLAAGGNIIVIWIVLAHKRMRTVTNYFLVNLATADALISIFNMLFNTIYNLEQTWWFGREYCKFASFISNCTISVSVLTFMAIAVDRYMAIIHPLRPRLTGRIVLTIILGIWVASVLIALPNLLYATTYAYPLDTGGFRIICYLKWPDGEAHAGLSDFIYNILLMIFNYFLPMATLAGTYTRIGWELWGSQAIGETVPMQAERIKSKRKVVKMMIVVVVIFGVCWLPTHLYFILTNVYPDITTYKYIQQIYILIYWLAMSNSMYNPIIYCWMNARFRQGFLRFFRWCPCKPCRSTRRMVGHERNFYSARASMTASEKFEQNGSLMQTTMESLDETTSTPSVYRMHPIGKNRHRDEMSFSKTSSFYRD